jgi:hypothetical protein
MEKPSFQMSVAAMLGLVACIAFNFWLFRIGPFWGIVGLNLTKHVATAYLCQVLGVDRKRQADARVILPAASTNS